MCRRPIVRILVIVLVMILLTQNQSILAEAVSPPNIESQSAILMDAVTGQILYAKNEHTKRFPASITKIMTALLALEKGNLETVFTADHTTIHIQKDSSHSSIHVGEQLTVEQLLYFTLIVSGNDAANALGQYVSGDLKSFSEKMTQRAKELGCLNTFFWNANGLDDAPAAKDKHMTTAYDMAQIMKRCVEIPKFREIISTAHYETPATNAFEHIRKYTNSNKLILKNTAEYYEYCIGGKTGWTTAAGNTLVTYAEKGERKLICVVLKASGNQNAYKDTRQLYEYGFDEKNFQILTLDAAVYGGDKTVQVQDQGKTIGSRIVSAAENTKLYVPASVKSEEIKIELVSPDTVTKEEAVQAEFQITFPETVALSGFAKGPFQIDASVGPIQFAPESVLPKPQPEEGGKSQEMQENVAKGMGIWGAVLFLLVTGIIAAVIILRVKTIRRIKRKKGSINLWRTLYNENKEV